MSQKSNVPPPPPRRHHPPAAPSAPGAEVAAVALLEGGDKPGVPLERRGVGPEVGADGKRYSIAS
eukprot:scaffold8849_cov101-Isochrysis_galbana.AAC.2